MYKVEQDFAHILKGDSHVADGDILKMYQQYLSDHKSKTFNVNTDMDRFNIFKEKVRTIMAHNANPNKSWEMGINHMTDMTEQEIDEVYSVMEEQKCSATASPVNVYDEEECWYPKTWDWRSKDVVSPVKDQKKCGSCWTFSTTGAMESHYKIKTGEEALLSEQELVDCASAETYDCHGCSGGLPSYAFNFIKDMGLETENNYPYQAKDSSCRYDASQERITTDGPFNITAGDEAQLKKELYWKGPISVAFQVVAGFKDYKSGVYTSEDCKNGPMDVNHAVLLVGYGVENGMDYWLIKNSWSDSWGDEGYFKIQRGVNMCGIAVCNSYPLNVRKAK
jgi:cathepsin H